EITGSVAGRSSARRSICGCTRGAWVASSSPPGRRERPLLVPPLEAGGVDPEAPPVDRLGGVDWGGLLRSGRCDSFGRETRVGSSLRGRERPSLVTRPVEGRGSGRITRPRSGEREAGATIPRGRAR